MRPGLAKGTQFCQSYSADDNPFFLPKVVDSLWILLPKDDADLNYDPIKRLEYKINKLELDGNEEEFILELENYLSFYLD